MNIIEKTYKWNGKLSNRKSTNRIILHHAESKSCTADDIHSWHLANGWAGIGYHFFVRKDGSIYRGRPENVIGSHAKGSNSDSIGICFEGSYMTETMNQTQINAGRELVAYLKNKYGISKVQKHKDVCSTNCPGTNFPFDAIVNGTVGNLGTSTTVPSAAKNDNLDSLIARGQQHSINFTGHSIATDGAYGPKTQANIARCFQHAINLDYGAKLKVDGAFGKNSKAALGQHYVKRKETQYLVTAVEIALMCRGYDPDGVECPGKFGGGLEAAVKQFQSDRGLKVDGIAGRNTILKLMGV